MYLPNCSFLPSLTLHRYQALESFTVFEFFPIILSYSRARVARATSVYVRAYKEDGEKVFETTADKKVATQIKVSRSL